MKMKETEFILLAYEVLRHSPVSYVVRDPPPFGLCNPRCKPRGSLSSLEILTDSSMMLNEMEAKPPRFCLSVR